jgi:hypothetical protein
MAAQAEVVEIIKVTVAVGVTGKTKARIFANVIVRNKMETIHTRTRSTDSLLYVSTRYVSLPSLRVSTRSMVIVPRRGTSSLVPF